MGDAVPREAFVAIYQGVPPWEIGRAQPALVEAADRVTGDLLDAGCGTGENALFFSEKGHRVLGFDFLEKPIAEARRKAAQRGLNAEFIQYDALELATLGQQFDSILDSGLFHVFSDEDRHRYVAGLARVLRPGGRLFMLSFSDEEPGSQGPRRVTQQEIRSCFSQGWTVEEIRPVRFEVVTNLKDISFSEGGPKAWFSVIRRQSPA